MRKHDLPDAGSRLDFVLRVRLTAESDCSLASNRPGRDQPAASAAGHHEQVINRLRVDRLNQAVPALVASGRGGGHRKPDVSIRRSRFLRRCLHLDSEETMAYLRHKVVIRAVTDWEEDERPSAGQPFDRRRLTKITLPPSADRSFPHGPNICPAGSPMARGMHPMSNEIVSRGARGRIASIR